MISWNASPFGTKSFTKQFLSRYFEFNSIFSNWIFDKCALNCVVHHFVYKIIHFAISFFQALEENGIWSLVIRKVGHDDAGIYECQTNSEVKGSVTVVLDIEGL